MQISLDHLDEAHRVLLVESKALIDLSMQTLVQFIQDADLSQLESMPSQLKEISGAMLFLGQKDGQQALLNSAEYLQNNLHQTIPPNLAQINLLLDVLASADMMIENLQSKQPVLQAMFDVALASSQKLASVA